VSISAEDERYLRQCLRLAARARGQTSPNPLVGSVVVKDGRVLATGYHRRAGLPHAEVVALSKLGGRAPGATLYVNLEPCNHHGRTAPCTDLLLGAGLLRVVVGMIDPNPLVNGKGVERLRRAGVEVETGVLEAECRRLNEGFVSVMERGRPFVTLKLAASADGRIATRTGESAWLTGEPARAWVHRQRSVNDAVLVGAKTARRDDPLLTVRQARGRDPLRVVVDSRARLPLRARMLREGDSKVIVATTAAAPGPRVRALERAGAEVWRLPARRGRVDLAALLRALAARGVLTVFCEGGATLAGALIEAGLADRLCLFYAPKILVGGVPILSGRGVARLERAWRLAEVRWRAIGDDWLLEGYLRGPK
jgi:diaminohydroxyphosphoribosylaminopyrimidine deaminase/5-amino-6-(5-phosphoribosylamino)uracil reductase